MQNKGIMPNQAETKKQSHVTSDETFVLQTITQLDREFAYTIIFDQHSVNNDKISMIRNI